MTLRGDILAEAAALTDGDRQAVYGEPSGPDGNMADIAKLFNAMTGHTILGREVPLFQLATKLARLKRTPNHRDSAVDGAAYLAIAHECAVADDTETG